MNAECKLVKREEIGDHVMFIGEVAEISPNENIKPLVYYNGKYWRLDDNNKIPRPSQELLEKVEQITKKYVKYNIQELRGKNPLNMFHSIESRIKYVPSTVE